MLIPDVAAESRSAFAGKHHQFRESDGVADSLFVTGDRLFGFCDGRVLVAQYIRPELAVERYFCKIESSFPSRRDAWLPNSLHRLALLGRARPLFLIYAPLAENSR